MVNLRQAFNAGVVGYYGAMAISSIHAHHPEGALLDIAFGAGVLLWLRHRNQKPSP